jgi:threonylcarbamoyladenosine tRNA methylthiotransferase MtaB
VANIFIETLGCKVNQCESAGMQELFRRNGFMESQTMETADVILLNTCTVTNRADHKSRKLINKVALLKKDKPTLKLIVTGCYTQINQYSDDVIDLLVDNNHKSRIIDYLTGDIDLKFKASGSFQEYDELPSVPNNRQSRAFLKIQDGCDFYCSYCVVPFARGKPRSRSIEAILSNIKNSLAAGYNEIVLCGVNLGLFYQDGLDLTDLLIEIAKFEQLIRIRLSSLEPQFFDVKLLDTIKNNNKICPHFHIPLQTGNDFLLKLHNRRYTVAEFKETLDKLNSLGVNHALGLDIIVGLPGETEQLFRETMRLLENIEFAYLHSFLYSKRKGTKAAVMAEQVDGDSSKERNKKLIELGKMKKRAFIEKLIAAEVIMSAPAENYNSQLKKWSGTSDRYIKMYFDNNPHKNTKRLINLKPLKPYLDGVFCD